jgi:hypothetical protein
VSPYTCDPVAGPKYVRDFGFHHEPEGGVLPRVISEEVQEIPLRHEGDELAARGEMREVRNLNHRLADLRRESMNLLVRKLEEGVEELQLMDDLEG